MDKFQPLPFISAELKITPADPKDFNLIEKIKEMDKMFPETEENVRFAKSCLQQASSLKDALYSDNTTISSRNQTIANIEAATQFNSESILELANAMEKIQESFKSPEIWKKLTENINIPPPTLREEIEKFEKLMENSMNEPSLKEKLIETINITLQDMEKYEKFSFEEAGDASIYVLAYRDYAFTKGISLEPKDILHIYNKYLESSKEERQEKINEVKGFIESVITREFYAIKEQADRLGIGKELFKNSGSNTFTDLSSAASRILGNKISSLIGVPSLKNSELSQDTVIKETVEIANSIKSRD